MIHDIEWRVQNQQWRTLSFKLVSIHWLLVFQMQFYAYIKIGDSAHENIALFLYLYL